ncbi:hypothetical protein HK102_008282, partial [Quaeritorhiza haematococci]
MDDSLRGFDVDGKTFKTVVSTGAQPKSVAARKAFVVTSTANKEVVVTKAADGSKLGAVTVDFEPTAVAVSPDATEVAVGGMDNKIRFFTLSSEGSLTAMPAVLENNRGAITCLAYSPEGGLLAAGDAQKNVFVYDVAEKTLKLHHWVFHNARVNSIAWSPDGLHAASGSLDTSIEVWSVEKPMKHISIK